MIHWVRCTHCRGEVRPSTVFEAARPDAPDVSPENWEVDAEVPCPHCGKVFTVLIYVEVRLETEEKA